MKFAFTASHFLIGLCHGARMTSAPLTDMTSSLWLKDPLEKQVICASSTHFRTIFFTRKLLYLTKCLCVPKKSFWCHPQSFVSQNKHHFRGMLHPRKSILHTPKSSTHESCAQDTEEKHGKHGSGALLSSFPLLLVVVLAEHGGCLSSVDRDRGLRIWNEREARRNECETRRQLSLERVRNSLLVVTQKSQIVPFVGRDAKSQSGTDSMTRR